MPGCWESRIFHPPERCRLRKSPCSGKGAGNRPITGLLLSCRASGVSDERGGIHMGKSRVILMVCSLAFSQSLFVAAPLAQQGDVTRGIIPDYLKKRPLSRKKAA